MLYSGAAVLVLVYSLFRWGSGRDIVAGFVVMVIGFAASVLTDYTGLTDMIGGAAILLFAAVLGLAVRYRNAAREQLIERAKLTERELLARELHDTVAHMSQHPNRHSALPFEREAGVLLAVARGRTNAEIGAELHISVSTVKFHVASLMTKLGARNRVELAMWAYETKRVT